MKAALERFCFPVEEKLLGSEEPGWDGTADSVKDRRDLVIGEKLCSNSDGGEAVI